MEIAAIKNLLDEMERIEFGAADLYERLYHHFAGEDPLAASLFYMLSIEERSHARAVEQFARLLKANPFLLGTRVMETLGDCTAKELLALGIQEANSMGVADALSLAWLFEVKLGEGYHLIRLAEANPSLGRLLSLLGDAGHVERLCDFARQYGFLALLPERVRAVERRLAAVAVAAS